MMAGSVASIVLEVLTKDNYENWSALVKSYLQSKDLWKGVVEDDPEKGEKGEKEEKEKEEERKLELKMKFQFEMQEEEKKKSRESEMPYQNQEEKNKELEMLYQFQEEKKKKNEEEKKKKKNEGEEKKKKKNEGEDKKKKKNEEEEKKEKDAKALHVIQLSCGSENLSKIRKRKITTAKKAWEYLRATFSDEIKAIKQGGEDGVLHKLIERGDWIHAKSLIDEKPDEIFSTGYMGRSVLHVAVIAGNEKIVENLVKIGGNPLLKMQDKRGYTALALAAELNGDIEMAKCMVETTRCDDLLAMQTNAEIREDERGSYYQIEKDERGSYRINRIYIHDDEQTEEDDQDPGQIPVVLAAANGHEQMTRYLYLKTPLEELFKNNGFWGGLLLTHCITAQIFDIALELLHLNGCPPLPLTHKTEDLRPLLALAQMPSAYPSGSRDKWWWWPRFIYHILRVEAYPDLFEISIKMISRVDLNQGSHVYVSAGIKQIYDIKKSHNQVNEILKCFSTRIWTFKESELRDASAYDAMLHAAKHGITEFIESMMKANLDLFWDAMDDCKRGIFSIAVLKRQEKVLELMHKDELTNRWDNVRSQRDVFGNTLLHLAAELGPTSDLGQRYNAVLQMQREFEWFQNVEKIMNPKCREAKNADGKKPHEVFTKNHKELVKAGETWAKDAANSFSIVGTLIITMMFAAAFTVPGGNNGDGIPILLHHKLFALFIIADAISLFTSSASVLVFIGILTSRYAERDFYRKLPLKLLIGLVTLSWSVVSMIVAFCAALYITLTGYRWVAIAAISFASIPLVLFVPSQLRLHFEIFKSTISLNSFSMNMKRLDTAKKKK